MQWYSVWAARESCLIVYALYYWTVYIVCLNESVVISQRISVIFYVVWLK